jgi:hypothetical protein
MRDPTQAIYNSILDDLKVKHDTFWAAYTFLLVIDPKVNFLPKEGKHRFEYDHSRFAWIGGPNQAAMMHAVVNSRGKGKRLKWFVASIFITAWVVTLEVLKEVSLKFANFLDK